jgi:O-acetyl-ADP-ribose deacetylase (regulator of RNase III)
MISVIQGDITTLQVDAIVNAANSTLLGGGGVDGAIHRAAGPDLLEYCKTLDGCPTGEARISPGFNLPAKWVIHTVGPIWYGGNAGEPEDLANCYRNSLEMARAKGIHTIAFPGISTGVYGYPKAKAAVIALRIMEEYESDFDEIICCCFSEADARLYNQLLKNKGSD